MNYAQILDGLVVNVIVADADFIATQTDKTYVLCTRGGISWTYDGANFIAPQPFESWTLDSDHDWQPPTPKLHFNSVWNETALSWMSNGLDR